MRECVCVMVSEDLCVCVSWWARISVCVSWSYGNSLVYHKAAALDMLGGLDPGFFEGAESHDNDRLRL